MNVFTIKKLFLKVIFKQLFLFKTTSQARSYFVYNFIWTACTFVVHIMPKVAKSGPTRGHNAT